VINEVGRDPYAGDYYIFLGRNGRSFLKGWVAAVLATGISEMGRVAQIVMGHWKLIVNWITTRISNGVLEEFNSLLQSINSAARGHRIFEYIQTIGYLIGVKPVVQTHSM
jgi:transposase